VVWRAGTATGAEAEKVMTVRFDNERLAVAIADGEHAPGWVLEHDAAMAVLLDLRDARRDLALEGAIYGRANQVRAAWALRSTQPESMQPAIDRTGRGTMTDKHEAMAREFRAKPPSFGAHDHGWAHHDCARCDADLAALLRKVEQEVRDEVSAIMESACRKAGLIFGSPLHQDPAEGFEAAVVEAFSQRCALERER